MKNGIDFTAAEGEMPAISAQVLEFPSMAPDIAQANAFLAWFGADEFTWQTFDDDKARRDAKLAHVRHGTLAQHQQFLIQANKAGCGVFVTVNETDGKGRDTTNIIRVRAFFVDLDGAPLGPVKDAPLRPHLIVESGGEGRYHAYWFVSDCPLGQFKAVQKALIQRFNSDTVIHDLPRVMRLPGFFHQKDAPRMTRIIESCDAAPYQCGEFLEAFGISANCIQGEPAAPTLPRPAPADTGPETATLEQLVKVRKIAMDAAARTHSNPALSRHAEIYKCGQFMRRDGLPFVAETVQTFLETFAANMRPTDTSGGICGMDWENETKALIAPPSEPHRPFTHHADELPDISKLVAGALPSIDSETYAQRTARLAEDYKRELLAKEAEQIRKAEAKRKAWTLIPARELLGTPPPMRWLIKGYLMPDSLALLFGPPGAGKSLVAIHWAVCTALGLPWFGRKAHGGAVIYVCGEGHFGIRRRLKALEIASGMDIAGAPLFVSSAGAALPDEEELENVMECIRQVSNTHGAPVLVVVDTLARNFGNGDENSTPDMNGFVRAADEIRETFGCAVLVVHHSGLATGERARGNSALKGAMDAEFKVSAESGTPRLSCTKSKDFEPPTDFGFEIQQIQLPWLDEDGEPETSVVLTATEPPAPQAKPLTGDTRKALEILVRCIHSHGIAPPEGLLPPEVAPPTAFIDAELWREQFYDFAKPGEKSATRQKAFTRASKALQELRAVSGWRDYVWLTPADAAQSAAEVINVQRMIAAAKVN